MRPEAVQKYGVNFMSMINSLSFPFGGFRNGGLHKVMHQISGFRDGGLVNPVVIPAFQAGGLVEGGGDSDRRAGAMRPLNLTIGTETFGGLLAPEETAKAMERASIGKQISSTGTRPRWSR